MRIVQFNEPTAEEFGKALDNLEKQGMQALVLDLRNNPGGLLNSAVDVLGQFLPPNTKGRLHSGSRFLAEARLLNAGRDEGKGTLSVGRPGE